MDDKQLIERLIDFVRDYRKQFGCVHIRPRKTCMVCRAVKLMKEADREG